MYGSVTTRRLSACVGVLLAALASIATSKPEWSLDDSVEGLTARLDTNTPESVHHFSVRSSQPHDALVKATLYFDASQDDPQAEVLIRIIGDDGLASELSERADGNSGASEVSLTLVPKCPDGVCEQGYSVLLKLVDGWPSEHVDVGWSFTGRIGGDGVEQPDGAFVEVNED